MVWLWEDLSEPPTPRGTVSIDYVELINTPVDKNSTWDYSYRTQVNQLETGSSYTAIIIIKEFGFEDWKGVWWWNNIEAEGQQYDRSFSLPKGCYSISTSLYESQDLSSDVKNATILSDATSDFIVGDGTCTDGVYSEKVEETNGTDVGDTKENQDDSIPGFGILLSLLAVLGASLIRIRQ